MRRALVALIAALLAAPPALALPRPAPPSLPAATAIVPVCQTRSYLLFFGSGSARLTDDSREILGVLMEDARAHDFGRIVIIGHADRAGDAAVNASLSRARVAATVAFLMDAGMPPSSIAMRSAGEDEPLVPTEDGITERYNRRVEIVRSWDDPPCVIFSPAP
jgi:OOP family OmpA-OmpF porin